MWRELVVVVSGEPQERQVEASLANLGAVTTVRERHYHLANVAGDGALEVAFDALADEYSDAERDVMATQCPDPRTILVLYMQVAPLSAFFAVLPAGAWVDTEAPNDLTLVRPAEAFAAALGANDQREQRQAVAELGDQLRRGQLDQNAAENVVTQLVGVARASSDSFTRERTFNAVAGAFDHYELPLRLLEPLAPLLPTMPPALLDYALYMFAATHDPAAHSAIEGFLTHPDPVVREYASDALDELRGRS